MGYKSREQQQEYQRIWRSRRRAEYFKDKSCVQCGSTEKLELDHIDPKTKKYSPAALWSMSDSNPNKIAELKKNARFCVTIVMVKRHDVTCLKCILKTIVRMVMI